MLIYIEAITKQLTNHINKQSLKLKRQQDKTANKAYETKIIYIIAGFHSGNIIRRCCRPRVRVVQKRRYLED